MSIRQPGSRDNRGRGVSVGSSPGGVTQPGSTAGAGSPRPAVGGSVRVVTRGTHKPQPETIRPRDLYASGGKADARPRSDARPTTTKSLVGLYGNRPGAEARPRSKPSSSPSRGDAVRSDVRATPRPAAVDRYVPGTRVNSSKPTARPRAGTGSAATSLGAAAARPRLNPRAGSTSVALPLGRTPVRVPRGGVTSPVRYESRLLGTACYGPIWDPCYSWGSCWDPCWSGGLTWSLGCGYGSFSWGWSSWYPWHCYRTYRHYRSYAWNWFTPCYDPFLPVVYCPTTTYVYADPAPATVVVLDRTAGEAEAPAAVSRRPLTPAEEAQKYVDLGDFYFREGRYADAADAYGRARSLQPDDATVHFVLADAVFAGGDYHFAAFLISEALRLEPDLAYAEADKRLLYGKVEDFERQMQTLMRYIADKPYDAMAHLVLGYNLKFSEQPKDAEKAFRRVLEIDPKSDAAQLFVTAMTTPKVEKKAADEAR